MGHFAKVYFGSLAVLLLLDFLWLGLLMSGFYNTQLGALARRSGDSLAPVWWAAIVVYLIMPAAIIAFVLPKEPHVLWGFVFGLVLYGVYDFTNYATLSGWTTKMIVVDTIWGGFVCAATAFAAGKLDQW